MSTTHTITKKDAKGRYWTIITTDVVSGFRWTVYSYRKPQHPGTLEVLYPGGLANGWSEMWHERERVEKWLDALMALHDSEPVCEVDHDQ